MTPLTPEEVQAVAGGVWGGPDGKDGCIPNPLKDAQATSAA